MLIIRILTGIMTLADSLIREICGSLFGYYFPARSLELVILETVLLGSLAGWALFHLLYRDPLPPPADYIVETRTVNADPPQPPKPFLPGFLQALAVVAVLAAIAA